jgi:hypothetical protein
MNNIFGEFENKTGDLLKYQDDKIATFESKM